MEDSDELRWAMKVVIKRQMRHLIEQLRDSGEEVAIMSANIDDNTCTHFGTMSGDWFISEQQNLTNKFLKFCQSKVTQPRRNPDNFTETQGPEMVSGTSEVTHMSPVVQLRRLGAAKKGTITVKIHTEVAGNISEDELAALVGRIVASQGIKIKGDRTLFDELVDIVTYSGQSRNVKSTIQSTRSGRQVSTKFKDSINILKPRPFHINRDIEHPAIVEHLTNLDSSLLKSVSVTTEAGSTVAMETTPMTCNNLENIATCVIQELHTSGYTHLLQNNTNIQVVVGTETFEDDADRKVKVTLERGDNVMTPPKGTKKRGRPRKYPSVNETDLPVQTTVKTENNDNEENLNDAESDLEDVEALKEDLDNFYGVEDDTDNDPDFQPEFQPPQKRSKCIEMPEGNIEVTEINLDPSLKLKVPLQLVHRKKRKRSKYHTEKMQCPQCNQVLTGKGNLKYHIERVHMKIKNHRCTICDRAFWNNNLLQNHMLAVHTRRCESCLEYVVESDVWAEGTKFTDTRNVLCKCGETVSIRTDYGTRSKYHKNDTTVKVAQSDRAERGTKYACGTCGKLFAKKNECVTHSKTHIDIKNSVCDICGTAFYSEKNRRRHMLNVHKMANVFCDVCNKGFHTQKFLNVHKNSVHGDLLFKVSLENVESGNLYQEGEELNGVVGVANDNVGVANDNMGVANENMDVGRVMEEDIVGKTVQIIQMMPESFL